MKKCDELIGIMSPTTLASLIADIQMLGTGADSAELEIERRATKALQVIVGNLEAKAMVADVIDKVCE